MRNRPAHRVVPGGERGGGAGGWLGRVAWAAVLLPLLVLGGDIALGRLGPEPVEALLHRTGWWALLYLTATLAVTPVRRVSGWNRLVRIRRTLGLGAFLYAALHVSVYVGIDQWFGMAYILEDVLERPFITAGAAAFLLLVPLAVTSSRAAVRRLGGKRWQRLHRAVYLAAALAALHFFGMVKLDTREPLLFAAAIGALLAVRLLGRPRPLRRTADADRSLPPSRRPRVEQPARG